MNLSQASRSGSVMMVTIEVRPWRVAFLLDTCLPPSEVGPVDFWALRMLASSCFCEISLGLLKNMSSPLTEGVDHGGRQVLGVGAWMWLIRLRRFFEKSREPPRGIRFW